MTSRLSLCRLGAGLGVTGAENEGMATGMDREPEKAASSC